MFHLRPWNLKYSFVPQLLHDHILHRSSFVYDCHFENAIFTREINETTVSTNLEDFHQQMQWFALPHGAIAWLPGLGEHQKKNHQSGRSHLESQNANFVLASLGLIRGIPISCYSAVQCKGSWQLVVMTVWKAVVAYCLNASRISRNGKLITGKSSQYLQLLPSLSFWTWYTFH